MTKAVDAVEKRLGRSRLRSIEALIDGFFFLFAAVSSVWLVWLFFSDTRRHGWAVFLFVILLWGAFAYLLLPRLHRLLTTLYVPNYFIGRSRTSDGLLGDPVNLAFNGSEENIHRIMQAAGWTLADPLSLSSSLKIVGSTLTRRSYAEAPVSTLKLFGRMQDFAYQQEVNGSPSKRHHIRFWRTPDDWPLPGGGRHVQWLAAATFDRAVGLSLFTLQVTHKISPDIDWERDHVVDTLKKADPELPVEMLQDFSTAYHSRNGGGDEISTDGNLPIVNAEVVPETIPTPDFAEISKKADPPDPTAPDALTQLGKIPRPAAVYLAMSLIVLQVISTAVWIANIGHHAATMIPEFEQELAKLPDTEGVTGADILWVVVGLNAAMIFLRIILAWGMWQGFKGARTMQLVVSTVSVCIAFFGWLRLGEQITLNSNFGPLAMSILILLSLTSADVRDFAHAKSRWRQAKKKEKRLAR